MCVFIVLSVMNHNSNKILETSVGVGAVVGVVMTIAVVYIVFGISCVYVVFKCYQYLSKEQNKVQPIMPYQGYPGGTPGGVVIMQDPALQGRTNLVQPYEEQHGK